MNTFKDLLKEFWVRFLVAGGCFAVGIVVVGNSVDGYGKIAGLLAMLPFLILGGIVIAPAVSAFLSHPLSSLFYPSGKFDRPQPMYSVQQAKRAAGLYEEAIAGFERIAAEYPGEITPYVEMINIAIMDLHDPERARRILGHAMLLIEDEASRKFLQQNYDAVVTRMELKPEWLQSQERRAIVSKKIDGSAPVDEPDGLDRNRYHVGGYNQAGKHDFVDERRKIARKPDTDG